MKVTVEQLQRWQTTMRNLSEQIGAVLQPVPEEPATETTRANGSDLVTNSASLFSAPGIVHQATHTNPRRLERFPVIPLKNVTSFHFNVKFTPGDIPRGDCHLFWWALPKHRNLLAYALLRNNSELVFRTDIGIPHTEKQKLSSPMTLVPGRRYVLNCEYNLGGVGLVDLTIMSTTDRIMAKLQTRPNVDDWPAANRMAFSLGNLGREPKKPMQPGWVWDDLQIYWM